MPDLETGLTAQTDGKNRTGRVIAVRGPVLDIMIDGVLPEIHEAVAVQAGEATILAETQSHLDEKTIRHELEGNICRCTGYHNIVKAIKAASDQMAGMAQAAE